MILSRIDPEARSTHAAAKGFRALCEGDTVLAKQQYTEAGKVLEVGAAQTESLPEKNLLRFLAASQYYHGGDYQRAKRLVRRTRPKYLSESDQEKFEQFRKDVAERADPEYANRIRLGVVGYWAKGQVDEAIRLLQGHPYVLERTAMAWLRADLCYMSERWHAAALFYADAIRFSESHPRMVFFRASSALRLYANGQIDAVKEYLGFLLGSHPTALDLVAATTVQFAQLLAGEPNAGEQILRRFEQARHMFGTLPANTQADAGVRAVMSHGFLLAALTADKLGDRTRAIALIEAGIEFAPNGPEIQAFRSILVDPGEWFPRWAPQFATVPAGLVKEVQRRETSLESTLRNAA